MLVRRLLPIPSLLDFVRTHFGTYSPATHKPLSATVAPVGDSFADLQQQQLSASSSDPTALRADGEAGGKAAAAGQVAAAAAAATRAGVAAEAREQASALRKGYLSVAKAVLNAAAGASVDEGGCDSPGGAPPQDPLRFLPDTRVRRAAGREIGSLLLE